jgi:hypothetical protein
MPVPNLLKPQWLIAGAVTLGIGALVYAAYRASRAVGDLAEQPGSTGSVAADLVTGIPRLGYGLVQWAYQTFSPGVSAAGDVVLPSGAKVSIAEISNNGGVQFDARSEQFTFVYSGVKYRLTGENDSSGRRVAVKA